MNISIYFHDDLNDFLKPGLRGKVAIHPIKGTPSVKHIIEALGVPHPEVGNILINQYSVDITHKVFPGDVINVYPISGTSLLQMVGNVKDKNANNIGFILDNHLGKLAVYLRMLGLDTLYQNNFQDDELARAASVENRILLTRDRGLLMRSSVKFGYWVRNLNPKEQLNEVVDRFYLYDKIQPFHRCLCCNTALIRISTQKILDRLEPLTKLYYEDFHFCQNCDRIYWKGSHYERMSKHLETIIKKGEIL